MTQPELSWPHLSHSQVLFEHAHVQHLREWKQTQKVEQGSGETAAQQEVGVEFVDPADNIPYYGD